MSGLRQRVNAYGQVELGDDISHPDYLGWRDRPRPKNNSLETPAASSLEADVYAAINYRGYQEKYPTYESWLADHPEAHGNRNPSMVEQANRRIETSHAEEVANQKALRAKRDFEPFVRLAFDKLRKQFNGWLLNEKVVVNGVVSFCATWNAPHGDRTVYSLRIEPDYTALLFKVTFRGSNGKLGRKLLRPREDQLNEGSVNDLVRSFTSDVFASGT